MGVREDSPEPASAMDGWEHGRKWQRELVEVLREARAGELLAQRTKTVYFVRHAQSRSNVAKAQMGSARNVLDRAEGAASLVRSGFNAPLSGEGRRQLLSVRPRAQGICGELEAVLFSPLQRACDTALGLFGDGSALDSGLRPAEGKFWRSVRALKEKRPKEHAQKYLPFCPDSIIEARAQGLIRFLAAAPWRCFALVGHSNFFALVLRRMGVQTYLHNAHIYRAELCLDPEGRLVCNSYALLAAPSVPGSASEGPEDEDAEGDGVRVSDF